MGMKIRQDGEWMNRISTVLPGEGEVITGGNGGNRGGIKLRKGDEVVGEVRDKGVPGPPWSVRTIIGKGILYRR
jgi:hypothetical protein